MLRQGLGLGKIVAPCGDIHIAIAASDDAQVMLEWLVVYDGVPARRKDMGMGYPSLQLSLLKLGAVEDRYHLLGDSGLGLFDFTGFYSHVSPFLFIASISR
ncbi:MAG: hypothetical protein WC479_10210 [Candidatus Izemoplasmatales bacterium]